MQAGVLETYFTDHKAVWASFHDTVNEMIVSLYISPLRKT